LVVILAALVNNLQSARERTPLAGSRLYAPPSGARIVMARKLALMIRSAYVAACPLHQ
jgi:hypothetical protein